MEDLVFGKICIRFIIVFSLSAVGTTVFSKVGIYYNDYVDYCYVINLLPLSVYRLYLPRSLKIQFIHKLLLRLNLSWSVIRASY